MKLIGKNSFYIFGFLVILGLVSQSKGQSLINWEDYLRNVVKRFISILQEREITGNGMPLKEFEGSINQSLYDIDVIGTAKFHSGFIAKIDASGIITTGQDFQGILQQEYSRTRCLISFDGLQTVFDVDYAYTDYKGRGTILTWYKQLQFEMQITRNHTTNEITSGISLYNPGSQNDLIVKVYPNNGYTQLTAKEIVRNFDYRENITASFRAWPVTWNNELTTAVSEYKFPEICYYCP